MHKQALATTLVLTMTATLTLGNFGKDEAFLREHTDVLTLRSPDGQAKVLVVPAWQGRVMTSSLGGGEGTSFGWINYDLVREGIAPEAERTGLTKHIHVFGGEERFWLGPEGGQYSLFFGPEAKAYDFESWKTPALMDTEPFEVTAHSTDSATFHKKASLKNRAGFVFDLGIKRTVSVRDRNALQEILPVTLPDDARFVAYTTSNTLRNEGKTPWAPATGLPSIWLLGMLKHSPQSVVAVPVLEKASGPVVRSDYFGEVDASRLRHEGGTVFFKADGTFRSKIGIPRERALPFAGSYDPTVGVLTLIHFNLPADAAKRLYVKSQWEDHDDPYAGDVMNAYNDGPPEPGVDPLGPFYELESSSPALALAPGEDYTHVQTTMHIKASPETLSRIADATLNCTLDEIVGAFGAP